MKQTTHTYINNVPISQGELTVIVADTVDDMLRHSAQLATDTLSQTLETVIIKAYEGSRKLKEVAAGINFISSAQLNRFDNATILSAVNTTPFL